MKKGFTLKEKPKDDQSIPKNTDTGENDQILLNNNKRTGLRKDFYMDVIHAIFQRYRKRVASYYCPNINCKATFWNAQKGYVCSECGSFGIISEYKSHEPPVADHDHTIIGYLDDIGRLICRTCVEQYGLSNDINYIVYNNMQPYCRESCEICRKVLSFR